MRSGMKNERWSREAIVAAPEALICQERTVGFQDVDAAGTIFFPKVLEYFSDAYLQLLLVAGLDVPGALARRESAAPLVHAEADYLAPLRFGDHARVEVVLARVGGSSTSYAHRIVKADGTVAAIGQTVHVWVGGASFTPIPVPAALRAYLEGRPGVTMA